MSLGVATALGNGCWHSCAIMADRGSVVCWGSPHMNESGIFNVPPGLAGVDMINSGMAHTLARRCTWPPRA